MAGGQVEGAVADRGEYRPGGVIREDVSAAPGKTDQEPCSRITLRPQQQREPATLYVQAEYDKLAAGLNRSG